MTAAYTVESFFHKVVRMEPENRRKFAQHLVASVSADEAIEAAQFDEVHRRMEDVQAGRMPLIAGKDALQQVREAILGRA